MNKPELLTVKNCQIIFMDHQPQMALGVQSINGTGNSGWGNRPYPIPNRRTANTVLATA